MHGSKKGPYSNAIAQQIANRWLAKRFKSTSKGACPPKEPRLAFSASDKTITKTDYWYRSLGQGVLI